MEKKLTLTGKSGIFRCYRQLEEPSNYSASIVYVDITTCKSLIFENLKNSLGTGRMDLRKAISGTKKCYLTLKNNLMGIN